MNDPLRWQATIFYRTDSGGSMDIVHTFAEISALDAIVERGPHWDTIERIEVIRINHNTSSSLTIERAASL